MLVIAVTKPLFFPGESGRIIDLLTSGTVDFVHVRKPDSTPGDVAALLDSVPEELHPRLTLHDQFHLVGSYNVGGIHLNSRNPSAGDLPDFADGATSLRLSRSLHTLDELRNLKDPDRYAYVTFSPVFPSISKSGYRPAYSLSEILEAVRSASVNVVALGGVTPEKLPLLGSTGFAGAAMLGHYFH